MDRLLVKTLLGRAKGSPLGITADYYGSPIHDVTLLSPFARQIRSLELKWYPQTKLKILGDHFWTPSTLHTLELNAERYLDGPVSLVAPTLPLFKNSANLKNFVVLTSLYLPSPFPTSPPSISSTCGDPYPVSELLDFLGAPPALRTDQDDYARGSISRKRPPRKVHSPSLRQDLSLRIIIMALLRSRNPHAMSLFKPRRIRKLAGMRWG
jgi:hypothetical protein